MSKNEVQQPDFVNEEILTDEQKKRKLTKEEYVEIENKWIEDRFGCDITTPYMTLEQIEEMEKGLPVEPNFRPETANPEHYRKIVNELLKNF